MEKVADFAGLIIWDQTSNVAISPLKKNKLSSIYMKCWATGLSSFFFWLKRTNNQFVQCFHEEGSKTVSGSKILYFPLILLQLPFTLSTLQVYKWSFLLFLVCKIFNLFFNTVGLRIFIIYTRDLLSLERFVFRVFKRKIKQPSMLLLDKIRTSANAKHMAYISFCFVVIFYVWCISMFAALKGNI